MQRSRRKPTTNHTWDVLEKICSDWVPMNIKSYNAHTGYFLFKDYNSDYIHIYLSKSKDSASVVNGLSEVKTLANMYNHKIKIFQSDGETEFISQNTKEFLSQDTALIKSQTSAPYKHSQNGDAEASVKSIDNKRLQIMYEFDCPPRFWNYAVKYAAFLHNIYPRPSNPEGKSPYQMVTGKVPDYSTIIPFYCSGVYLITKEEQIRLKYNYKSRPCHFFRYSR